MAKLAIQVQDANGNVVPNATITVKDRHGGDHQGTAWAAGTPSNALLFEINDFTPLDISWEAPDYFPRTTELTRDIKAPSFSVPLRSAKWGYYSNSTESLVPLLTLVALRVRPAPLKTPSLPAKDQEPPIVYDPSGILLDATGKFLDGLYSGKERGYPVVLGPDIMGDPKAIDWRRLKSITKDVDPEAADGGTSIHWLEYGDTADSGVRLLLFIWATNRAGVRANRKADAHVFFCPRTDTGDGYYAPAKLYPYKVKRSGKDAIQPYAQLAYTYQSSGSPASGTPPGNDYGIAYQSLATGKSSIIVMPINNFGDWGPLLCRAGLLRLLREVVAYVSDHAKRAPQAKSEHPGDNQTQQLNRVAISGYSRGAVDAAQLFRHSTIDELAAYWGKLKNDPIAARFVATLKKLRQSLWQSPAGELDRSWHEFYSVDGFYDSDKPKDFPAEVERWFAAHEQRIVRVYATQGRMSSAEETIKLRLSGIFTNPKPTAAPDPGAREWRRDDNRATLAWWADSYLKFDPATPSMPQRDAHHIIPRIVFSHAIAQSRLQDP